MNYVESFEIGGVKATQIPCIKGAGVPTTATEGAVGCLYMDTDNGDVFKCTAVADGVYIWEGLGSGVATDEKYFDIDYDGIVSLKPEYRGSATNDKYPYAISDNGIGMDGSKIHELPEIIVVPDVINGTAVSGFQEGTFRCNGKVREITFPDGVDALPKNICASANNLRAIHNTEHITKLSGPLFSYTRITKAFFPNLKEVSEQAFAAACFLYTVDIGNNITEIPSQMFLQCLSLSRVIGGEKVTKIGDKAFWLTSNLKNLPFLDLQKVTSVGQLAFYKSRIQFDWSKLDGKCTFGNRATPVIDNATDYWTGVEYTPRENSIVTIMSQDNAEWAEKKIGNTSLTYKQGCATFAVLHIHSALSGKLYNHPDEFINEVLAIDPNLVADGKLPDIFENVHTWLTALGYKTTVYQSDITQATYQAICDALARGAYVYTQVSTEPYADRGHVVALYGMNSIGEVSVLDSNCLFEKYRPTGIPYDVQLYRMPYQNLSGPSSDIVIVEKE